MCHGNQSSKASGLPSFVEEKKTSEERELTDLRSDAPGCEAEEVTFPSEGLSLSSAEPRAEEEDGGKGLGGRGEEEEEKKDLSLDGVSLASCERRAREGRGRYG